MVFAEPIAVLPSARERLMPVFRVAMSEMREESLPSWRSPAGFRVRTTTTARTARMAMTTRSSMRVKPFFIVLEVKLRRFGQRHKLIRTFADDHVDHFVGDQHVLRA